MNRTLAGGGRLFLVVLVVALVVGGPAAHAATRRFYGVGARYHTTHDAFAEYPFRDGDLTWQAGMEFHEGIGFWQLLVGYTPSVDLSPEEGLPEIDSVITPQLNLILQDQGWLAGTGILASYIETEFESDWSDLYWQTMIGYQFKMQYFTLDLMGVYAFDDWDNISDFDFDNVEFSAMLKRSF